MIVAALVLVPCAARGAPFDDARDNILAGQVGNALMIIAIGAMGINDQDDLGYTLLHYAAKSGSVDAVRQLLDQGADPAIAARDGSTPITLATTPDIRGLLTAAAAARHATSKR